MRTQTLLLLTAVGSALAPISATRAAASDPAAARIEAFSAALLDTLKQGKALGFQGRAHKLQPVVEQTFNLPVMAQFAVGAPWSGMSTGDRASVVAALSRYTVARYAHDFDSYNNQRFSVDPAVQTRGPDKLVKSQVLEPGESPVTLNYRLREYSGAWRVIDVYYNGVSQLTTERADFASVLGSGGAAALVKKLDSLTAKLR